VLCDICHKNIATVHLTEIVGGKVMEFHICQDCARLKAEEIKEHINISEFLSNLTVQDSLEKKSESIRCSLCGASFSDFKKKGRLGCAKCYETFKSRLLPIIKKVHGASHHKGKIPPNVGEDVIIDKKLTILRERLKKAIEIEAYEEAATIRDQIRRLERGDTKDV